MRVVPLPGGREAWWAAQRYWCGHSRAATVSRRHGGTAVGRAVSGLVVVEGLEVPVGLEYCTLRGVGLAAILPAASVGSTRSSDVKEHRRRTSL